MSRFLLSVLALAAAAVPLSASADSRYGYDDRYEGYSGYRSGAQVRCSSNDERPKYCNVDTRDGVRLVRQESRSPCIEGRSWGYDQRGIWVANGCRAQFQLGGGGYAGGRRGGSYGYAGGYDSGYRGGYGAQLVRCESRDDRQRFCPVPGGLRDAQIVRRLSDTRCRFNYNWGFQRDGIWVDRGCRAEFRVN